MGSDTVAFLKEILPLVFMALNGVAQYVPVITEALDRAKQANTEGRDVTKDDWDWLNTQIASKREEIRKKLAEV